MPDEVVVPSWSWPRKFGLAAGVRHGNTIYLSGYVSVDSQGIPVGEGDMYAQSKQVFQNIQEALESAGVGMTNVVKLTAYLVDISRYAEFAQARAEFFPNGVPASTAVATPALAAPIFLVEVEAIAAISS